MGSLPTLSGAYRCCSPLSGPFRDWLLTSLHGAGAAGPGGGGWAAAGHWQGRRGLGAAQEACEVQESSHLYQMEYLPNLTRSSCHGVPKAQAGMASVTPQKGRGGGGGAARAGAKPRPPVATASPASPTSRRDGDGSLHGRGWHGGSSLAHGACRMRSDRRHRAQSPATLFMPARLALVRGRHPQQLTAWSPCQ